MTKTLHEGFIELSETTVPYFSQWTYNEPIIIPPHTNHKFKKLQEILYKAIHHFVENYEKYRHLMPVSHKVDEILALCKDKPYQIGTYRTDFLIDEKKDIKIIEITCRFALNAFVVSGFQNIISEQNNTKNTKNITYETYTPFFDTLKLYLGDHTQVCLLKNDSFNEGRYLKPMLENAGYHVHVLELEDIPKKIDVLEKSAIIGQLQHEEWCSLPLHVIKKCIDANILNDLRTVFLIHDKRFFSVLCNDFFIHDALSKSDAAYLHEHLVPTWHWNERKDVWDDAKKNKDKWIIKPRAFGRAIGVKAGILSNTEEWNAVFQQNSAEDLILQPYIPQYKFNGTVGDEHRNDYVVGTLLYFDNNYFGPGVFRASSHPITNHGDTRRVSHIITDDIADYDEHFILKPLQKEQL